mmetsp:Transcript_116059/g.374948  ORF Transcript_116059/g.374948 Transcript_116059/m.374948 type:complete len:202 (+) Transcript_116059:647-1252(+)
MRSPARAGTIRGRAAAPASRSGSLRGSTKKSLSRSSGQRSKTSAWLQWEPGSAAKPPVPSSLSVRLTRPWTQAKWLPVVLPFWSVWNQPPRVRQPASTAGGRKAQAPSKLTSRSSGLSTPQTLAKALSTRGRVRTCHMKGVWPMPSPFMMPLCGCAGQAPSPQEPGSPRCARPCVAASTWSQKSSVARSTSSPLSAEAKTA